MTLNLNARSFFLFDLDDTLYNEVDFLKSGYRYIASELRPYIGFDIYERMWRGYKEGANVFEAVLKDNLAVLPYKTTKDLLNMYRYHVPDISLHPQAKVFMEKLRYHGIPMGLITDGRSITQRNKLRSLGLADGFFSDVLISEEFGSEKPDLRNYLHFMDKYPGKEFFFMGDNTTKDFVVPDQWGWASFCLKDQGSNIHRQDLNNLPSSTYIISSCDEINPVFTAI